MKPTSFRRIIVSTLVLGTASLATTFAQAQTTGDGTDASTPSTPSPHHFHHHHGGAGLTADERTELKNDYQSALANNADLKTDSDNLKAQEKALREQAKALHEKVDAAMVAADPNVQPILAKLKADHKGGWHHHHHGGQPADSSTTPAPSGT
jgi:Spy/CpxP family protein refolding chaperone